MWGRKSGVWTLCNTIWHLKQRNPSERMMQDISLSSWTVFWYLQNNLLSGVEVLITLWINSPFLILYWQLANVLDLCFISSFEKFSLNNLPFYCGFWVIDFLIFIMYNISILCWWSKGLCLNQSQAFSSATSGSASTLVWVKIAARVH
jgi:hypothetical protein